MKNRIDRLRVRHLRLLELVAATGSLTAAAQALHISQPGATKMLQELEAAFGRTLIDRNTRGGALSPLGALALDRLRVALSEIHATSLTMQTSASKPLIRIGMLPVAGVALIPKMVLRLSNQGELPRLRLHEGTVAGVFAMLRAGEIDCMIGRIDHETTRSGLSGLFILPLTDERLEIACAPWHPMTRRRGLTLQDIATQSWIAGPRSTYTRQMLEAAFLGHGLVPPEPEIECTAVHTNLAMVAQSEMLTIAPRGAVSYYEEMGRVKRLRLAEPFPTDHLVLVTLSQKAGLVSLQLVMDALKMDVQSISSISKSRARLNRNKSRSAT